MSRRDPRLTHDQWIGALILALMLAVVATVIHVVPQPSVVAQQQLADSLRRADSLDRVYRREFRLDSLRAVWHLRDSLRRDSLHAVWHLRDSLRRDSLHAVWHLRDSLRRDSLHQLYPSVVKKDTVLELNSADTTELMYLRGIGSTTARRIVRLRTELGGFYSIDQLEGIVPDTIWPHFTVDPARIRRLSANQSSVAELARHPYIGFEQAKALYQLRRREIRLSGIEDLKKLDCWQENDLNRLIFYLSFE